MGTFAPGWSFRPQEITLAHLLKSKGYRCAHFGKWHVGAVKADSPLNPGAMGFDQWLSHDNFFELNPSLSRNGGPPEVIRGESSEILIDEAIRFLNSANSGQQPFLVVIWFGSPHEPYQGLPADLALYDDLPAKYSKKVNVTSLETGRAAMRNQGEVLRERYAEITAMDRSIGKLRTHLQKVGLRDNTLLFYCGDNGTSGDAALGFPHRGHKGQIYDGGTLVPGLIEWPARIKQPTKNMTRMSTCDLLPTLCGLVQSPLPNRPIDGIDMSGVLEGSLQARSKPLYFWEYQPAKMLRLKPEPWIDPKLQEGTTPLAKLMGNKATRDFTNYRQPPIVESDYEGPRSIIDGKYKLILQAKKDGSESRELFDLDADPAEQHNLVEQYPTIAKQLHEQLTTWQKSVLQSLSGADYSDER
jgi:arylsulfatase A-like enzyme